MSAIEELNNAIAAVMSKIADASVEVAEAVNTVDQGVSAAEAVGTADLVNSFIGIKDKLQELSGEVDQLEKHAEEAQTLIAGLGGA